jgi:hypothetical protein
MEAAMDAADGATRAKQRMTQALQECGGAGMTKTELRRVSKAENSVFESVMRDLITAGAIVVHRPTGARSERWFLDGIEVDEQL